LGRSTLERNSSRKFSQWVLRQPFPW